MTKVKPIEDVKLEHVKVSDIAFSETNKMFRNEKDFEGIAFLNLGDSIKKNGVLQPVLLRGNPKGKHPYELVCGERRLRAAISVGLEMIPAQIKILTDAEALDAQVIENKEREDVHPMNEAKAYKTILESYDNDLDSSLNIADMAARFGKSESYITRRLSLLKLSPIAEKNFLAGNILLSHALVLSRLSHEDQKYVMEENHNGNGRFGSATDFEDTVERSVIRELKKAPFDTDSAELHPKAGSCTTCAKRSGTNPLLFGDIKSKDTCFDGACFQIKKDLALIALVKETIEKKPDVVFLCGHGKYPPGIDKILKDHGLTLQQEYTDFTEDEWNSKGLATMKGLWINDTKAGQIKTVWNKHKKVSTKVEKRADGKAPKKAEIAEAVGAIQQRMKRNVELDAEKVYDKIVEALPKSPEFKTAKGLSRLDWLLIRFMALHHGYGRMSDLNKIDKLSDKDFIVKVRETLIKNFAGSGPHRTSDEGKLVLMLAENLIPKKVKAFRDEQDEIAVKRTERAKKRIKDLKTEK